MNTRAKTMALVGAVVVALAYVAIPAAADADSNAAVHGIGSNGLPRPVGASGDRLKTAEALIAPDGGLVEKAGTAAGSTIVYPEGGTFPMSQPVCSSAPQTIVIMGTTAVQVPTSQLSGRKALRVCVSLENAGSPKVKCLLDGTPGMTFTPDVGVAQGDVMAPGDCYVYPVDTSHTVKCISDTASTGVLTWEC